MTFLDNLANPLFPMTVHVSRINLVNQQGGDLQRVSKSRFQVPFCDHKERREIRRIVADAFGTFFVIDPTNLGQLRIRLSGALRTTTWKSAGSTTKPYHFRPSATDRFC